MKMFCENKINLYTYFAFCNLGPLDPFKNLETFLRRSAGFSKPAFYDEQLNPNLGVCVWIINLGDAGGLFYPLDGFPQITQKW